MKEILHRCPCGEQTEPITENELTSQELWREGSRDPAPKSPGRPLRGNRANRPAAGGPGLRGCSPVCAGPLPPELCGTGVFRFRQTWKVTLRMKRPNKAVVKHSGPSRRSGFPFALNCPQATPATGMIGVDGSLRTASPAPVRGDDKNREAESHPNSCVRWPGGRG